MLTLLPLNSDSSNRKQQLLCFLWEERQLWPTDIFNFLCLLSTAKGEPFGCDFSHWKPMGVLAYARRQKEGTTQTHKSFPMLYLNTVHLQPLQPPRVAFGRGLVSSWKLLLVFKAWNPRHSIPSGRSLFQELCVCRIARAGLTTDSIVPSGGQILIHRSWWSH